MWPLTQQLSIKLNRIIYKLTADQYYIILLTSLKTVAWTPTLHFNEVTFKTWLHVYTLGTIK
jgi:hypothetical protein